MTISSCDSRVSSLFKRPVNNFAFENIHEMSGTPWRLLRDLIPLVGTIQANPLVIDETHMPRRVAHTKTQKRQSREWPTTLAKLEIFDEHRQQQMYGKNKAYNQDE